MKFFRILMTVVVMAVALISVEAQAVPTPMEIMFWDGLNAPLVVFDGGTGDVNPAEGAVTVLQPYFDWSLNVSTGVTYPVLGSVSQPWMDFNSVNVSTTAAGPLTLFLSADGFVTPGNALFEIGGTTSGALLQTGAFWTDSLPNWGIDPTNVTLNPLFDAVGPLTGAFSATAAGPVPVPAGQSFALTLGAFVFHDEGGGSTSFNQSLTVPEPASIIFIGVGLLGLVALARRRGSFLPG